MPDVLIEVRGNWIGPRKTQMIEAIHLALVEAIRIPQDDKVLFPLFLPPKHFLIPKAITVSILRLPSIPAPAEQPVNP
jgi:hypothetical protein